MSLRRVCRPGGFALTERLLRWYEEEALYGQDPTSPRLLADVGCGEGASLHHIRSLRPAWTLVGVDPGAEEAFGPGPEMPGERAAEVLDPGQRMPGERAAEAFGPGQEKAAGESPENLLSPVRVYRAPAEELPLEEGSADVILMECSLSRMADPERALQEALRVCKRSGRLLISDMYRRAGGYAADGNAAGGPAAGTPSPGEGISRPETLPDARGIPCLGRRPVPAPADGGISCSVGRLETAEQIRLRLERAGWQLIRMMDVSRVLGDWVGQKIFDGEKEEIPEILGMELCELKSMRAGYYLCEAMPDRRWELVEYARKHSPFYRRLYGAYPPLVPGDFPSAEAEDTSGTLTGTIPQTALGDTSGTLTGSFPQLGAEDTSGSFPGAVSRPEFPWDSLPLTAAEDIRREPEALRCVPPGEVARIITLKSSGSEGAPKRIFFTEEDLALTAEFFDWGIRALVRPGDRVTVFMTGPTHYSVGGLLKEGLSRLPAEVEVHGLITDYDAAAEASRGRDCLIGVPAQLYRLMKEHPELRPRTVLLSADNVPEAVIRGLEETWHCQVFTHWGMSETGYGGGVQCRCREGYHLRDRDLLIEILDPDTGRPVPEGEYGEIVLTTRNRRAMPLIRYRTGDVGRLLPGPCPCGSLMPRLDKVRCRLRGIISTKKGKTLTLPQVDEVLYRQRIRAYRGEWSPETDTLALRLLPEGGMGDRELRDLMTCTQRELREALGEGFPVSIRADYDGEGAGKRRLTEE